jgi:hypothetical protein
MGRLAKGGGKRSQWGEEGRDRQRPKCEHDMSMTTWRWFSMVRTDWRKREDWSWRTVLEKLKGLTFCQEFGFWVSWSTTKCFQFWAIWSDRLKRVKSKVRESSVGSILKHGSCYPRAVIREGAKEEPEHLLQHSHRSDHTDISWPQSIDNWDQLWYNVVEDCTRPWVPWEPYRGSPKWAQRWKSKRLKLIEYLGLTSLVATQRMSKRNLHWNPCGSLAEKQPSMH